MIHPGFTTECGSAALLAALASTGASAQVDYEIIDLTEAAAKIGVMQSEARSVTFPGTQPTLDAGIGIGYGTGLAIEGGGTYIKCGLDIEKYYRSN